MFSFLGKKNEFEKKNIKIRSRPQFETGGFFFEIKYNSTKNMIFLLLFLFFSIVIVIVAGAPPPPGTAIHCFPPNEPSLCLCLPAKAG